SRRGPLSMRSSFPPTQACIQRYYTTHPAPAQEQPQNKTPVAEFHFSNALPPGSKVRPIVHARSNFPQKGDPDCFFS
ncbi:MAG: hypothetical protein ACI4XQ_00415, partial [Eubacteriales bacterium]